MASSPKKLKALTEPSLRSGQRSIAAFGKVSKPNSQAFGIAGEKETKSSKPATKYHQTTTTTTLHENVKKRKYHDTATEPLAVKTKDSLSSSSPWAARKFPLVKSVSKQMPIQDIGGTTVSLEAGLYSFDPSTDSELDLDDVCASPHASYANNSFGLNEDNEELLVQLSNLRELFKALLKAASLHYAHNGSRAPVDFNQLKPIIERIWGKRGIKISDIQRVIGVATSEYASTTKDETETVESPCHGLNESCKALPVNVSIADPDRLSNLATSKVFPLSLSDFGNGKVCVELADVLLDSNLHFYPINITALIQKFDNAIDRYKSNGTLFTSTPLAAITPCASVKQISASQSRTRSLIADLKAGAVRVQADTGRDICSSPMHPLEPPLTRTSTSSPNDPLHRSNALKARILAKKAMVNQKPAPPTSEALARRAAFQRLDEVVGILDSLITIQMREILRVDLHKKPRGAQTSSFTMPMLVQAIQGSMRNPIGKAEVSTCMTLLAEKSIGKGYVSLNDVATGCKIGGDFGKIVVVKGGVGVLRGKMADVL